MRSPYFQRQLGAVMEQTTRNQVPVTKQVELSLAIPPIEEQRAIVTRAGSALDSVRTVSARLAEARSRVEWTSAAVMSKAFRAG
jgi:type I restriction enzyme S subunit